MDVYGAMWVFTTNHRFYPGTSSCSQDRVGSLQAHVSYSLTPLAWIAFDAAAYRGGQSSVDGARVGDRLTSSSVGATLAFPIGRRHGIKIAYSTGVNVRFGADFDSFSIGWNTVWVDRRARRR